MKEFRIFVFAAIFLFSMAAIVKADNSFEADALTRTADDLYSQNNLSQAAAKYREALKLNSRLFEAQYNLALTLSDLGKTDEAIAEYQKALRINPDDADTHYNLGNCYYQKANYREAVASYERSLRLNPNDTDAKAALQSAKTKLAMPKPAAVLSSAPAQNFTAAKASTFAPLTGTATKPVATQTHSYNVSPATESVKAAEPVKRAASAVETAALPKTSTASKSVQSDFYTLKKKQLTTVPYKYEPKHFYPGERPDAQRKNFTTRHGKQDSYLADSASAALAMTINAETKLIPQAKTNLTPKNSPVTVPSVATSSSPVAASFDEAKLRRQAQEASQRKFEAEIKEKEAVRKKEEARVKAMADQTALKADTLYNQGNASLRKGDSQNAIRYYQESLNLRPSDKEARFSLGLAYDQNKNQQAALEQYEESLRIDPNFLPARYNLGLLLYKRGDKIRAKENFNAFLKQASPREHARQIEQAKQILQSL